MNGVNQLLVIMIVLPAAAGWAMMPTNPMGAIILYGAAAGAMLIENKQIAAIRPKPNDRDLFVFARSAPEWI